MYTNGTRLDTSNELLIFKWNNGIKLCPPHFKNHQNNITDQYTSHSVNNILQLPINIYFMNTESEMVTASNTCLSNMGFYSLADGVGKTMFDISPRESAMEIINTDKNVLQQKKQKITEDTVILSSGEKLNFLTFKMPWYNTEKMIIGVFGYSILLEKNTLASSLSHIIQLGLLQPESSRQQLLSGREINGVYLTKKEIELLHQMIRGKTAKAIAKMYGVSFRTIEERMQHVKRKFGVSCKADLIELVVDELSR